MLVFSAVTSNEINRRNFEDPDGSPPLRLPSLEDTFDTPSAVSFAGVKYDRPPESVVKLFFQSPKTQRVFVLFIFFLAYAFGGALLFRFIERDVTSFIFQTKKKNIFFVTQSFLVYFFANMWVQE